MNGKNLSAETEDPYHLTPRQRALFEAIQNKSKDLAKMFLGAIFVLNDKRNPDRFALAAHGFRELMEKMPRCFDSPMLTAGPPLKTKIAELKKEWEDISCDSKAFDKKLEIFFSFCERSTPKRKDNIKDMLNDFDPMRRSLPQPIAEFRTEMFDKIWGYFIQVAHHKRYDEDEFKKWQNAMEGFMIDIIVPRTFEDFANIDAIIVEGENNDHA